MSIEDPGPRLQPLSCFPAAIACGLIGVCTDIDDTLTRDGEIEISALEALHDLAAAGMPVIAITGRPLGWSQERTGAWPLAALVAENGAVALVPDDPDRRRGGDACRRVEYAQDEASRGANAIRLRSVLARILAEVPGARTARDSPGRVTDIAIDHAEFARLEPGAIAQVVALMTEAGMNASVSSIHVNGWFGDHDKWTGAAWMLRRLWGRDLSTEVAHWICVGDSPNDEIMFRRFPHSVGVANLLDFGGRVKFRPAWITPSPRGAGFAELARMILAARR